jgi:hypothetical protein
MLSDARSNPLRPCHTSYIYCPILVQLYTRSRCVSLSIKTRPYSLPCKRPALLCARACFLVTQHAVDVNTTVEFHHPLLLQLLQSDKLFPIVSTSSAFVEFLLSAHRSLQLSTAEPSHIHINARLLTAEPSHIQLKPKEKLSIVMLLWYCIRSSS